MTAEAIHNRMHGEGYCFPPCGLCLEVEDLLASHAHELAEKIRTRRNYGGMCDGKECAHDSKFCEGVGFAARLIDPEARPND